MSIRSMRKAAEGGGLRGLVYVLAAAVAIVGMLPNTGGASVLPADQAGDPAELRAENLDKIKAALEREEVAARLADYGLTPEEVGSRLDGLTDEQVSEAAAQVDRLNAGGDALGLIISVLLVLLLVLLILHLLGYIDLKAPGREKSNP